MMALKLKKSDQPWKAGPAQVFNVGIMFFYLQVGQYKGEKSPEMKALETAIYGEEKPLRDDHYEWYWVALQVAYFDRKATPNKILKMLPPDYQKKGKFSRWGKWFSRMLCRPEDRYTLQQAWEAYRDL